MTFQRTRTTKRLLIASLLALPMALAGTSAYAGGCPGGSCGGPNEIEQAVSTINASESTVSSGSLKDGYNSINAAAENADKLSVSNSSKVRNGLKDLVDTLKARAMAQYEEGVATYKQGNYEKALALWAEVAELKGLPVAKLAAREIAKEDDRKEWRQAREKAIDLVTAADHLAARDAINDLNRLARRTDYTGETRELMDRFSEQLMPRVEKASALVASGQFDNAYAGLIEISRLTYARKSAAEARRELSKHAGLDGMRQAKGEYEGKMELAKLNDWIAEIAHPSPAERKQYQAQLQQIAAKFPGTRAATHASELLNKQDNRQAFSN